MSSGLPENDRERNGYHEAGHVVLGWLVRPEAIGYVEIGEVVSRSRIYNPGVSPLEVTTMALAGSLAEAQGISGRNASGDLFGVAGQILMHHERRLIGYGAQQLDIPVSGRPEPVPASFSDDDFERIHPDFLGSPPALAEALREAARLVHQEFVSGRIKRIQEALLRHRGLSGDEVRRLLG